MGEDRGELAFVLSLCVGVLCCLLFPQLGQFLSDGARAIFARGDYTLIACVVVGLLLFEWLFSVFLGQMLNVRGDRPESNGEVGATRFVLWICAAIGALSLALTFFWSLDKPVGPYW